MAADAAPQHEAAPAKVNLFLHLCGQRSDGYHLLESLAVFPALGDMVGIGPPGGPPLAIDGPFGQALEVTENNLVLRAAHALARHAGLPATEISLHLTKNLPVASGIGGGSADAAATLRLLARHWQVGVPDELALSLGADVPVCLRAPRAQIMRGAGEDLTAAPAMPGYGMVLVNPRVPVETGAVFAATERKTNPPASAPPDAGFPGFCELRAWLAEQRNDLTEAAVALCPPVGDVLQALHGTPLARMSGSGATCFALFERQAEAAAFARDLGARRPGWWVAAAAVAPNPPG